MLRLLITIALLMTLTACQSISKKVMPPMQYAQTIPIHSHKDAYLYWKAGNQLSATDAQAFLCNGDLVAIAICSAISQQGEKNRYTYGHAHQAVFMTSMRDILAKQKVFKQVKLITVPKKISADDVLITIYFKSTRVSRTYSFYGIILTAEMTIQSKGKKNFQRTYSAYSSDEKSLDFLTQQKDVSEKLFAKLITGLNEWYNFN